MERSVATYLDRQERLFFWYRNRARKDYFVQGWKRGRIYADFVFTLKVDEPDAHDSFHQVFVMETKGVHLKRTEDTEYKRSVFDICSERARQTDWAEFAPAMQGKVVRFEVVDEDQWQQRLNAMLAQPGCARSARGASEVDMGEGSFASARYAAAELAVAGSACAMLGAHPAPPSHPKRYGPTVHPVEYGYPSLRSRL